MITQEVKNCSVFSHFSKDEQKCYFDLSSKKVIHNIDTLYFSCFINEEEISGVNQMLKFLEDTKENMIESKERERDLSQFGCSLKLIRFSIYEYCLSVPEMYDIFISSYLPNEDTPRAVVQLRSIGLWTVGTKELIQNSVATLSNLLEYYSLKVVKIAENRIDYAYHTNIIQNTYKYFNDSVLLKHLKSSLTKYQKVGSIRDKITLETMTLGNKKSNNIFFRCYNKTTEVIEMNYKGFFFDYWYRNKLISFYDRYCLEYAYQYRSARIGLLLGRCQFYIEYGKDKALKETLQAYLVTYRYKSSNCDELEKLIGGVLPEVTIIMNVEFQTKRKFYQSCSIENLKCSVLPNSLYYDLYRIIDNRKVFLDYLTSKTVCFWNEKKNDYCQWWQFIRRCKIASMSDLLLVRDYARKLDFKRLQSTIVSKVATSSIYQKNVNNNDFSDDIVDLLSSLNDNDMCLINSYTGEVNPYIYIDNYEYIKLQKSNQLKKLLENTKLEK